MNDRRVKTLPVLVGMLLAVSVVSAQQSASATYDRERKVSLQGPVTRIEWVNPNAFVFINVRDAAGVTTNWAIEVGNPLDLERDGWKRSALKIGDVLAVEGIPARGAKRQALATSVNLAGKRVFAPPAKRPPAPAAAPTPRWPDGQVRLGPPAGGKGYWGAASANALVESTASKVPMNEDGLLTNLADADKVAPFKPWAKAVYEQRQRELLRSDPVSPLFACRRAASVSHAKWFSVRRAA